ncbi:SusC/RagA family TonB-linked outer membrane protein [Pedobacter sp. MW01-1-1]|uniref:SusC/RagA family TonB-linked outer membrane protein n=1 Tax=Pedobacter sp. MW01-1-1 TaxID=3383027 RepID=UPI003FEDE1DF
MKPKQTYIKLNWLRWGHYRKKTCIILLLCSLINLPYSTFATSNFRLNYFQNNIVEGQVMDEGGEPLPGVTIQEKNSKSKTVTDALGRFKIRVKDESSILVFVCVGLEKHEIPVGSKRSLIVTLKESTDNLKDVYITGYQTIKANETTGSYARVTKKQLERKTYTNLQNKLEGMVPGLTLITTGGTSRLEIRGRSSIGLNNTPLIVVDGFPMEADISTLNPNTIENITVLKDATAASIYGVRSSNGVIVITTKKGTSSSANINFISSLRLTSAPDLNYFLNRMSSNEQIDMAIESFIPSPDSPNRSYGLLTDALQDAYYNPNDPSVIQYRDDLISSLRTKDNLSQLKDLYRVGTEFQNNLALRGGTTSNKYYVSLNNVQYKDVNVGNSSNRTIFNIKDNLNISKIIDLEVLGAITFNNSKGNLLDRSTLLNMPSYMMLKDENGNPLPLTLNGTKLTEEINRLIGLGLYDETFYPLNDCKESSSKSRELAARIQANLNFKFKGGFTGIVGMQYERANFESSLYESEKYSALKTEINNNARSPFTGENEQLIIPFGGRLFQNNSTRNSYTIRAQANYNRSFSRHKHVVSAIAGGEMRHIFSSGNSFTRYGFNPNGLSIVPFNELDLLNATKITTESITLRGGNRYQIPSISENTNRFIAMYANGAYTYNGKYTFNGSVRIDQSNLFGTDPSLRFRPLWSAGVAWDISKESFFSFDKIDLKFRYTYGLNGNTSNRNSAYNVLQTSYSPVLSLLGNSIISPANTKLRWETTKSHNFGMDLSLLEKRITINVDYYNRIGTDLLAIVDIDGTFGFDFGEVNQGSMYNRGVDLGVSSVNIKNKNFSWSSNLTLRFNKNRVTEVKAPSNDFLSITNNLQPLFKIGYPANSIFGPSFAGLNNTGQATYYKKDGSTTSSVSDLTFDNLVYLGTIEPTYSGGLTNVFGYKNVELSFLFIFNGGNVIRKDTYAGELNSTHIDATKRWKQPGDENTTTIPARTSDSFSPTLFRNANVNVLPGDYIKLREVTLSYNLPNKLLMKLPFKNLGVNFQANNIYTWTKNKENIDPETQSFAGERGYRIMPAYTFGINATF